MAFKNQTHPLANGKMESLGLNRGKVAGRLSSGKCKQVGMFPVMAGNRDTWGTVTRVMKAL